MGKSSGIYYVACCFIFDDITINMGRQYWNSMVILCIVSGQSKVYSEVFVAYFRALAGWFGFKCKSNPAIQKWRARLWIYSLLPLKLPVFNFHN